MTLKEVNKEHMKAVMACLDDNIGLDNPDIDLTKRHGYIITCMAEMDDGNHTFMHYMIDPATIDMDTRTFDDVHRTGGLMSVVLTVAQREAQGFFSSVFDAAARIVQHRGDDNDQKIN